MKSVKIALAFGSALTLAACTQTAAPVAEVPASPATAGVREALADAQAAREKHSSQQTAMNIISIFDPIGVTDIAEPIMKAEQQRELDEKYKRVEAEAAKAVAEAEAKAAARQAPAKKRVQAKTP